MLIHGIIALPQKLTSLTEVLPNYEQNILTYNASTQSWVDTHMNPLPPNSQILKGIAKLQIGVSSNLPSDNNKEIAITILGYNLNKQNPLVIFSNNIVLGKYINFAINTNNCLQNTLNVLDPYFEIQLSSYTGTNPATGTLFTFRINQIRDNIYENY